MLAGDKCPSNLNFLPDSNTKGRKPYPTICTVSASDAHTVSPGLSYSGELGALVVAVNIVVAGTAYAT